MTFTKSIFKTVTWLYIQPLGSMQTNPVEDSIVVSIELIIHKFIRTLSVWMIFVEYMLKANPSKAIRSAITISSQHNLSKSFIYLKHFSIILHCIFAWEAPGMPRLGKQNCQRELTMVHEHVHISYIIFSIIFKLYAYLFFRVIFLRSNVDES